MDRQRSTYNDYYHDDLVGSGVTGVIYGPDGYDILATAVVLTNLMEPRTATTPTMVATMTTAMAATSMDPEMPNPEQLNQGR